MSKHRQLLEGAQLPQDFLDALQEFLGTYVSPNFTVEITDEAVATTLRVPAGSGNDQVGIAINGRWRYITANADFAAPGVGVLTVGENPIFVAASENAFSVNPTPPPSETDSTDYGFRLLVKAPGDTPSGAGAEAVYRQVGTVLWDGSHFTDVKLSVGTGPRLHTPWSVTVHRLASLTVPNATETLIPWEAVEERDDNLGFMPIVAGPGGVTQGAVEITDPGTYLVSAFTVATVEHFVRIMVNSGAFEIACGGGSGGEDRATATGPYVNAQAGDIISAYVVQNSGGSATLTGARLALVRLH